MAQLLMHRCNLCNISGQVALCIVYRFGVGIPHTDYLLLINEDGAFAILL